MKYLLIVSPGNQLYLYDPSTSSRRAVNPQSLIPVGSPKVVKTTESSLDDAIAREFSQVVDGQGHRADALFLLAGSKDTIGDSKIVQFYQVAETPPFRQA